MRRLVRASSAGLVTGHDTRRGLFGLACLMTLGIAAIFSGGPAPATAAGCANEALRVEQGAQHLPDCRAWEKVTPAEKGGVHVAGLTYEGKARAAASGGKIVYASNGQFADPESGGFPAYYYSERGANGWSTESMLPANSAKAGLLEWIGAAVGRTSTLREVDDELETFYMEGTTELVPGAQDGVPAIYRKDGIDGEYNLLTPPGPDYDTALFGRIMGRNVAPVYISKSANGRWVTFITAWNYETESEASGDLLYKVDSLTGELELVGILPGDEIPPRALPGSLTNSLRNAISNDGSRVYFCTDEPCSAGRGPVYLREGEETREIGKFARFWAATSDGAKVLFQEFAQEGNRDGLFLTDVDTEDEISLSEDVGGAHVNVRTVIAVSDDLSRVYFTGTTSPIVPGYTGPDQFSSVVYLWEADGSGDGEVRFVADLTGYKEADRESVAVDTHTYLPHLPQLDNNPWGTANPDGTALAFTTIAGVTDYDSGDFREVYYYDVVSGETKCISCPSGPATGHAQLLYPNQNVQQSSTNSRPLGTRNSVSHDGRRVFFQTPEGLVGHDTNGINDVYVYDTEAEELSLLSSGTSSEPAAFLAADASGDELFIVTSAKLLRTDRDELADVYSVKVGGGFPLPPEPQPECSGEACQGPATPPPAGATAASSLVNAPGNPPVRRKKAKKKAKKAKCVKSKAKAKKTKRPLCKKAKKRKKKAQKGNKGGRR